MQLKPVPRAPSWLKRDEKSGIYWVDMYRANANPRRITRSTKIADSKERAKIAGEKIIAAWLGHDVSNRIRFDRICDEALALQKSNRPGTYLNAKIYIGKIKDDFGHLYVDQITEGLWKNFEARFRSDHPEKHFFNFHKHMSLVMNHAYRLGLLKRPWCPKMGEDRKKPARVLTKDEQEQLLVCAAPTLRDQLLFAMTMGMRLREHLLLSWSQINFDANTITLEPKHTKTKRGRTIIMSQQVRTMLLRRKARAVSDYVFPSRENISLPARSNKKAWGTAKEKAGIKGRCRYHDLRHTWLTDAAKQVRSGRMSSALVCAYAGLSLRVFERNYLHLGPEDTAEIAELIAVKLR